MHEEKHALDEEESKIIQGALEMIDKQARHAMTPLKDVFMLEESTILDGATINQVVVTGHSRVPVYRGDPQRVVGLFLTRSLVGLDDSKGKRLCDMPLVEVPWVNEDTPLYDILNQLKCGQCHMAMVVSTDGTSLVGIITLEDLFEELIKGEIVDETDVRAEVEKKLHIAQVLRSLDQPIQLAIRACGS